MSSNAKNTSWIIPPSNWREGRVDLFCFPYAGGGTSIYRKWSQLGSGLFNHYILQMPSREQRLNELGFRQMRDLIPHVLAAVVPHIKGPFAFYGHSMGALIAFELMKALPPEKLNYRYMLFVGGRQAPNFKSTLAPIHELPDETFIQMLYERYRGIPQIVFENREFWEIIIPALRDDIALVQNYEGDCDTVLRCPISVFSGTGDAAVDNHKLLGWRNFTNAKFFFHPIEGDHFFLNSNTKMLIQHMEDDWRTAAMDSDEPVFTPV